MMRPASQYAVYLLAVSLFCGCGTTGGSRNDSISPAGDDVSRAPREYDSGSSSRGMPSPPPPAPAAYGVSHMKRIGFLRVLSNHGEPSCGSDQCADACGDSGCCEKRDEKRSFGDFCKSLCCKRDDNCGECASGECATDSCAEPCRRKKRGLFQGLCGKNDLCLFGHSKCASECGEDNSCCGNDVCCDDSTSCSDACGESACCDNDDCCLDWAQVERECGEGCQDRRHPCLADSLEDPFVNGEPIPEQVPEPAVPAAPTAPVPPAVPENIPDPPQAYLMAPFTGISSQKTIDTYFPSESGEPHQVIEPPQWRGRGRGGDAVQHRMVMHREPAAAQRPSEPESFEIMIQPRQTVEP